MSWFSPVGCCSSQCRVPKQTPAFPQGDALCAGLDVFMCPDATALNTRNLPPWAMKREGNRAVTPHSHELTARYYLIQSYCYNNLQFITHMSILRLPGFQMCAWYTLINLPIGIEQTWKMMSRRRWGVLNISTRGKKSKTSPNLATVTKFWGNFANASSNNSNAISASVVILQSVRKTSII